MITQRYGDLEVGFVTNWRPIPILDWFATAQPPSGWYAPGSVCGAGKGKPWAEYGALVLKDRSSSGDLLKPPTDYKMLHAGGIWTVWRPIPPAGYVALGDVIWPRSDKPGADARVACVKRTHGGRDYARQAELSREPLMTGESDSGKSWSYRSVVPPLYPDGDDAERLLLLAGTCSYGPREEHAPTEVTWILDVPAVVEKEDYRPELKLTSYEAPPELTVVVDRAVTVPYSMVVDTGRPETWKVAESPFYKILRKRHYKLVRHVDYRGHGNGAIVEAIEQGVTKEESEEFSRVTGISTSFTTGVEAGGSFLGIGASAKVETSVSTSVELGYSSRYSVQTFESKTVSVSYNVPADHAGALWSDTHELTPVRGDGVIVTKERMLVHSGAYVGRTYPDTDGVAPNVSLVPSSEQIETAKNAGIDPEELPKLMAQAQAEHFATPHTH